MSAALFGHAEIKVWLCAMSAYVYKIVVGEIGLKLKLLSVTSDGCLCPQSYSFVTVF